MDDRNSCCCCNISDADDDDDREEEVEDKVFGMVVVGIDGMIEEACKRVLMTSNGLVIHAATVPAAPPDKRLFLLLLF